MKHKTNKIKDLYNDFIISSIAADKLSWNIIYDLLLLVVLVRSVTIKDFTSWTIILFLAALGLTVIILKMVKYFNLRKQGLDVFVTYEIEEIEKQQKS